MSLYDLGYNSEASMSLSLSKIDHLLTHPHIGKTNFTDQDQCSISHDNFVQAAGEKLNAPVPRPYVMVYVVDAKKFGSFYQAEHYTRYTDAIKRFARCENSNETVVKVHYLIVKNLKDGVEILGNAHVGHKKNSFERFFTLACSSEKNEEILQARKKVIPQLLKKEKSVAKQLLEITVSDFPDDSFSLMHLAELENDVEKAAMYKKQYETLRKKEILQLPCTFVRNNLKSMVLNSFVVGGTALLYVAPEAAVLYGAISGLHAPFTLFSLGKAVHRLYQVYVNKRVLPVVEEYPPILRWVKNADEVQDGVAIDIPFLDNNIEDEDLDYLFRASHMFGNFAAFTKTLSPVQFLLGSFFAVPSLIKACSALHEHLLHNQQGE